LPEGYVLVRVDEIREGSSGKRKSAKAEPEPAASSFPAPMHIITAPTQSQVPIIYPQTAAAAAAAAATTADDAARPGKKAKGRK